MKPDKKSKWEKPELTVLTRNKPEEAVLAGCKTVRIGGPGEANFGCDEDGDICNACLSDVAS